MKKLLITLLLISPFSFADWGDVYYCQMTTLSVTTLEGERADYKLEKFRFQLDKTKNAMVFGQEGAFDGIVVELTEGFNFPSEETWHADSPFMNVFFQKGKFLFSLTALQLKAVSADCDKF